MNVLLDVDSIRPPLTGIGNYALNLLRELDQKPDDLRVTCFSRGTIQDSQKVLHAALSSCMDAKSGTSWWRTAGSKLSFAYYGYNLVRDVQFSRAMVAQHHDVYHGPAFVVRPCEVPSLVTIHDLAFLRFPETQPVGRIRFLQREVPRSMERARRVLVPSAYVRNEIKQIFSIPEDKLVVTPLGVAPAFAPRDESCCRPVLAVHQLSYKQYLLFVGTIEPRKNLDVLLDAWSSMPGRLRERFPLVVVGAKGWHHQAIIARMRQLSGNGLQYLSYVSQDDLPLLYAGARALVAPSIYEGFGLPVLEAMASGTPVICSANTAMAEVSIGAACLVDSADVVGWRQAMIELCEHDMLMGDLGHKGVMAAAAYTWAQCAQKTLDTYASVR